MHSIVYCSVLLIVSEHIWVPVLCRCIKAICLYSDISIPSGPRTFAGSASQLRGSRWRPSANLAVIYACTSCVQSVGVSGKASSRHKPRGVIHESQMLFLGTQC